VNSSRSTYTISGGLLTSTLIESWVSSAWTNADLLSYTYDGGGHQTQYEVQLWQSNAWVNQTLTTYTYNGNDRSGSVMQTWQSNAWTNLTKHSYAYNGSHLQILDTSASWFGSSWFASFVDTTKYSGTLISEKVHASLFGAGSTRTDYTYDTQGYEIIEVGLNWNIGTQQWDNSTRSVFVYTPGGSTSCCVGKRGNVNGLGIIDLVDLSSLINYLTGGGYVLPCPEAANVNGSGIIDLVDLSSLINYLTGGGYVLPNCP
jgi:hypothetical protein